MAVVLLVEIRFFFFTDDKKVTGNRTNIRSGSPAHRSDRKSRSGQYIS